MKYRVRNERGLLVLQVYAEQPKALRYRSPPSEWGKTEWVWRDATAQDISTGLFAEDEPAPYRITEAGRAMLRDAQQGEV